MSCFGSGVGSPRSRRCCEHWSGRSRLVGCQPAVTVAPWTLSVQPTCTARVGPCARSVPSWASRPPRSLPRLPCRRSFSSRSLSVSRNSGPKCVFALSKGCDRHELANLLEARRTAVSLLPRGSGRIAHEGSNMSPMPCRCRRKLPGVVAIWPYSSGAPPVLLVATARTLSSVRWNI
jgi:hypothetical protein